MLIALVAGSLLASAHRASASLPHFSSGTSVGEGVPLKAYATLTPQVHLFGDVVTAKLAVVADTKWVDPERLHVSTDFTPYKAIRRQQRTSISIGRFQQVTWTWTLRCITTECVPRAPPSELFHIFRFQAIHIEYLTLTGKRQYGIDATWPKVQVVSQVSPSVATFLAKTNHLSWRFHISPVAAPTYRVSPGLLFWLSFGAGIAMLLIASAFGWRWYRLMRPRKAYAPGEAAGTPLERALAVLAWAHARGDETLERKALERVAGELGVETPEPEVDELSRTARELAWSSRSPEDEEVETFAERARGTGRPSEEGDA